MDLAVQPAEKPTDKADAARPGPESLIDILCNEQQQLTAVDRFSAKHAADELPAQAKYYRDLIPLQQPQTGEQYAFEVDLDLCSGCKACVSACHHMNGLESEETWRFVGQLTGVDAQSLPVVQHVTTACHHCIEPGCLSGCPTNAYEKDPVTGVVRHLDDQCFGCQYCTMACPYEVPQYSKSKGIVRKCDMCHDRLSAGEAPACVQACPNQAIRITNVSLAEAKSRAQEGVFLASSQSSEIPSPRITLPTTIYRTERALAEATIPADAEFVRPQEAHLPLVVMLVLTQWGVGLLACAIGMRWLGSMSTSSAFSLATITAVVITHVGLFAALMHLGRPHLAFRGVLGWRHSWLSREAIVFGLFTPLAIGVAAFAALPWLPLREQLQVPSEVLAILAGCLGVYCSVKIYQFTQREFWIGVRTSTKFGLTPWVLGLASLLTINSAQELTDSTTQWLVVALLAVSIAKLSYEARQLLLQQASPALRSSALLMRRDLQRVTWLRFLCGCLGGIVLPLATLATSSVATILFAVLAVGFCLFGELCERYLYFAAVVPLKMPGGIPS